MEQVGYFFVVTFQISKRAYEFLSKIKEAEQYTDIQKLTDAHKAYLQAKTDYDIKDSVEKTLTASLFHFSSLT